MSLDVYLKEKIEPDNCECPHCGNVHKGADEREVYWANITHNLGTMADAAGIYKHLWRPEEIGISKAYELIEPLKLGLSDLKSRPEYFSQFNSPNGWGMYEHFVPFVEKYLSACIDNPDATIHVSR